MIFMLFIFFRMPKGNNLFVISQFYVQKIDKALSKNILLLVFEVPF